MEMTKTYYVVKFEQFFEGHSISDGVQSLDNRYSSLKQAMEVATLWELKFPEARIRVERITVESVYDSKE